MQIGDSIGGFRLQSRLGEGGMGVVWLAEEQSEARRRAALKVLPPDLARNGEIRERFLRETHYASRVKHPNVAEVYGSGEDDGHLWLAMRYLEGTDLASLMRRGGPLQARRALSITGQAAAAIDEANASGLLHRDIKPANIMLTGDDHAYVIDFGLGKAPATDSKGLTKPGQFVGTIDYTAPEQITHQQTLGPRVDQYSLACVLYEMLTGQVPFARKRDVEVIMAHVNERPPTASDKREGLPPEIDAVLAKGMAKDPEGRYESSTAFFEAASEALAPVLDRELPRPEGLTFEEDTVWLMFESGDEKGRAVPVTGEQFVVGRGEEADLQIIDTRASRRHAALKVLPGGNAEVRDLDSSNGTFVDGAPVRSAVLTGRERIQIGNTELSFHPVDPVRSRTEVGAADRPRVSEIIRRRGASAVHRLRIERRLRYLTIAAGSALAAALVVLALLLTGAVGGGEGIDKAAVISAAGPGTALVRSDQGETGSGWALDAGDGLFVTNAHVINGGRTFQVGTRGGRLLPATVVGVAPCDDLAVLRSGGHSGVRSLELGSQSSVREGDDVVALGYPLNASAGAQLTATAGVVSVARTTYRETAPDVPRYPNVIQIDAALNPGNSGGPLLDKDRELIGVNSAVRTENEQGRAIQSQNYAIGVDRVKQVVTELRKGRSIAWTGLNFTYPATEELADKRLTTGLMTSRAVEGSPADRAGVGDGRTLLIIGVNGKRIQNTLASYCEAAGDVGSGRKMTLTVQDVTDPEHPSRPRALELRVP